MKIEIENSLLVLIIIVIGLLVCIGASYAILHQNTNTIIVKDNHTQNNTTNIANNTNTTISSNQEGCSNCANGNQGGSYYWVGNKEYCSVCHRLVADLDNEEQQAQAARDMEPSYHYGM